VAVGNLKRKVSGIYFFTYLTDVKNKNQTLVADTILQDIIRINGRKIPGFLREFATHIPDLRKKDLTKQNKRQVLRELS
jgi:hypothetical protein